MTTKRVSLMTAVLTAFWLSGSAVTWAQGGSLSGQSSESPGTVPAHSSLGVVELNGEFYRINGLPGDASFSKANRSDSSALETFNLFAEGGDRWARGAEGTGIVEFSTEGNATSRFDAGIAIGRIGLSESGTAMAVANENGSLIQIYMMESNAPLLVESVELGSSSGRIRRIRVDDQGNSLAAVREIDSGWLEAINWEKGRNSVMVLAQGKSLRVAVSKHGDRMGVLDEGTLALTTFSRGNGGSIIEVTQSLPLETTTEADVFGLEFVGGELIATRISGRAVKICREVNDCQDSELPMPVARSVRTAGSGKLLFVESGREDTPSYLAELNRGTTIRWHFVGRGASQEGSRTEVGPIRESSTNPVPR